MKDKEYKELKSKLQKLVKKWFRPAGFGWWRCDFVYSRERMPDNEDCAAKTIAEWRYSHATITFYMPVLVNLSDEELEHTFVHELCHLTASGYPNFNDTDDGVARFEKTVDDFAKHIIWAAEHVKADGLQPSVKVRANTEVKSKLAPKTKDRLIEKETQSEG